MVPFHSQLQSSNEAHISLQRLKCGLGSGRWGTASKWRMGLWRLHGCCLEVAYPSSSQGGCYVALLAVLQHVKICEWMQDKPPLGLGV